MASRNNKQHSHWRTKVLEFFTQQSFYLETLKSKMKSKKTLHNELKLNEKTLFQKSQTPEIYAQNICDYIIQSQISVLNHKLSLHPTTIQLSSQLSNVSQKRHALTIQKMNELYKIVKYVPKNAPFRISNAYQHPYQQQSTNKPPQAQPALKKQKTNANNLKKPKIETKLPSNLTQNLKAHLSKFIAECKEYEELYALLKVNEKKGTTFVKKLQADLHVFQANLLQKKYSEKDLRAIYEKQLLVEKQLPGLRISKIEPEMREIIESLQTCDVVKTVNAHAQMRKLLRENDIEKPEMYCNTIGTEHVLHELFECENETLNDDLQLLKDFGVTFVAQKNVGFNGNIIITFGGHFGDNIDWLNPPSLVVKTNEKHYCHSLQRKKRSTVDSKEKDECMEFNFVLKIANPSLKRRRSEFDNENGKSVKSKQFHFCQKHINWLNEIKKTTISQNGAFIDIPNVYNFYHNAVTVLIKEHKMLDNSKLK